MKKHVALFMAMVMMLTAGIALAFNADSEIVVVSHEEGSGTRAAFVGNHWRRSEERQRRHPDAEIQNATSQVLVSAETK